MTDYNVYALGMCLTIAKKMHHVNAISCVKDKISVHFEPYQLNGNRENTVVFYERKKDSDDWVQVITPWRRPRNPGPVDLYSSKIPIEDSVCLSKLYECMVA